MKKTIISFLLFALAIVGYWVMINKPSNPNQKIEDKPVVKIGLIYPLSGDGAVFGKAAQTTAEIFMNDFSRQNPQFDYQLFWEDNQLKQSQTVIAANRLINLNKVDVLITTLTNHGQAVSPIAEKNKVLHLSIATDPAVAKGQYNFNVATSPERESLRLVAELKKRNVKTLDAIVMNAQGPEMIFDVFKKIAEENKIKVNQIFKSNAGERDYRMIISKINDNNPDIIMAMLQMPEIDIFMRQLKESDSRIPVTGIESFSYLKNKALAEGMFYVDAAGSTEEFATKFQAQTGEENTLYGEYLYTIMQILTKAYESLPADRKPNTEEVATQIIKTTGGMNTAIGTVTINAEGVVDSDAIVKQIIDGKTLVF